MTALVRMTSNLDETRPAICSQGRPDLPPVFIIGPARSGTTVLAHQIAAHFDVQCTPETNCLAILQRILHRDSALRFGAFERAQEKHLMHGQNRNCSLLFPTRLKSEKIVDHPRAFVRSLIEAECYTTGRHVLEQTPRNGEHALLLRFLFPDAIILFVARNPFDTVQSKLKTPWGRGNILMLLALWMRQFAELRNLVDWFGRDRVRVVRYAKLESEGYRRALFAWLAERGIAPRAQPEKVVARNHAGTSWAGAHLRQSSRDVRIGSGGKLTRRLSVLKSLGDWPVWCSLRFVHNRSLARCRVCMALIQVIAGFSIRWLKR